MGDEPQSEPESGPKYISAGDLAKLGGVSVVTMNKLIGGRMLVPAKFSTTGMPLFDPDAPDVVAWLRAIRGRWPLD